MREYYILWCSKGELELHELGDALIRRKTQKMIFIERSNSS